MASSQRRQSPARTPTHAGAVSAGSGRAQRYLVEGAGLSLDFSRNRLTDEVLEALLNLARACGLEERRTALFRGGLVNLTEQRPALHTALREGEQGEVRVNGDNVIPEIHRTLGKMEALVESIHSGERTGHSGARFTDVVSIGIGGSFLGPKLAVEALRRTGRAPLTVTLSPTSMAPTLPKPWHA